MDRFGHLSDAQLEQYGTATTGSSGGATGSLIRANGSSAEPTASSTEASGSFSSAEVEHHLEDCPECRTRLLQLLRLHFAADLSVKSEPTPGCSSEDTLRNLAAGLPVAPADPIQIIHHAAECDHCGPLLHELTDIFADDLSPEDAAMLAQLKTSSPEWQSATGAKMHAAAGVAAAQAPATRATTPAAGLFGFPRLKWVMMPATLAACAAIAFSTWWAQRDTPEKVERLLAQAYTEQRTMELRIPYAEHADFKQTRSGDTASLLSSPAALRKAADLIAANLKKNPDDPKWLMLSARLDLLDWRYKSALSTLNKIDDDKAEDSPEFRLTRSLALYQKAEMEHDPQSYGQVVDLLGKNLQASPDDPVALFNQGVACEKLQMFECALKDYEKLATLSPNSGWTSEAVARTERIKQKKTPGH